MHLLLRWVVTAVALGITIYVLQSLHEVFPFIYGHWTGGHGGAAVLIGLFAGVVWAIVNAVIRPIAELLALPITCLTLGLFSFVVNGIMFWLVGVLSDAFRVNFWGAVVGSLVMGVVSGLCNWVIIAPTERAV
jgi:putative membrane protein